MAIFGCRQRVHVTHAAAAKMTRRGMVYGVGATPEIVGCQGDHANDATRPVVRTSIGKERPMTAVMLDHEQTYEKASGGEHDKERTPPPLQPNAQPPPRPPY